MTDTARLRSDTIEPVLDLDAMLLDLHNNFEGEPGGREGGTAPDDQGDTGDAGPVDPLPPADETPADSDGGDLGEVEGLEDLLPPGHVQVGDEVLTEVEARALLELNRRAKGDPAFASRLATAVNGEVATPQVTPEADALPAWLDPDDQQGVFLYRQQQRLSAELEEMRRNDLSRQQIASQQAKEQREGQVRDAFREGMREFKDDHPQFDLADLKGIADRAAAMRLLENPEAVGGTLKAGIVSAFEAAMFATPEYREKAVGGATVPSRKDRSTSRKQKSSALSSSTGSVVRTQSQEQTPTTRKEVMASALDFLRSQAPE